MLIANDLLLTLSDGAVLAASDDGDGGNFALILLASGFVFYFYVFMRYRNAGKRHKHEQETEAHMHNMRVVDRFIRTRHALSNRSMSDSNNTAVRGSLNTPFSGLGSLKKFIE